MPELGNILGIGSFRIETPGEQTFASGVFSKVAFDQLTRTSPIVGASIATDEIIPTVDGFYKVTYLVNVIFSGTEVMQLTPYVNGVAYTDDPVSGAGEGAADPLSVGWQSWLDLNAGDVVDLRAANGAVGDLVADIRRGIFSLEWRGNS